MNTRIAYRDEARIISLIISSLNENGEALLSYSQIASLLGISKKTVQRKMPRVLSIKINNTQFIKRRLPKEHNNIGYFYSIN